uniref:Uncharacterized protein n=1 Tax=Avena sativa TaxID=4498 RepID=A0ACD5W1E3_AVESA
MYQHFVNQVAVKVCELEEEYKKIAEKLRVKLDDIFEPTIKIKIETNEIAALCDLGESVSIISKSLFTKLNLGSFEITELKFHLAESTYKQAVGIKENTLVYIKGYPALIDFVIVDMPEDATAPIILHHPFLRIIKALINLHEENMKLQLPSRDTFVIHFPKKKNPSKMRRRPSL